MKKQARFERNWRLVALVAGMASMAWCFTAGAVQRNNAAGGGTIGVNGTSTKGYPSNLVATYAVTGANLQIDSNTALMNTIGGAADTMFRPNLDRTTTTSVQLQTLDAACLFPVGGAAVTCNRGTLTISFSRPVLNPTLHFLGIGGQNASPVDIISSRTVHTLTTAGVTMTLLGGATNLQVTGTTLDLVNTGFNSTSCTTPTAPATQLAGCGSVRFNGTVTSLTFTVQLAARRNNVLFGTQATADAYQITATVDEDYGDAPATYDAGVAASHIVGPIRLGATVDIDNPNLFNDTTPVTPSPFAVAAGADNNGAAGDGVEEDGLSVPLATLHTGLIGQTYTLTPSLSGSTAAGTVCGWIDFNRNNVFETAEGTCNAVGAGATSTALNWTVPIATTAGRSYVRLRATQSGPPPAVSPTMTAANATGRFDSGEVEDYMIEIKPAVRVIKLLNPTGATGRFDLGIGGTAFALAAGHNGTTNFRTLYHNSASGAPDLTVAQDITTTAVTTTVSEVPTPATTALYVSTYACVNGAGTTVGTGSGTSTNITLPLSVPGAAANGRAQTVTCTFTNRLASSALSLIKTESPVRTTYTPGGSTTYTLQACNAAGADPANGAAITDTLPPGVTLSAPWSCTGAGGGTCSAANGGVIGGNLISLTATAMPAGGCINVAVPVVFSSNPADY